MKDLILKILLILDLTHKKKILFEKEMKMHYSNLLYKILIQTKHLFKYLNQLQILLSVNQIQIHLNLKDQFKKMMRFLHLGTTIYQKPMRK